MSTLWIEWPMVAVGLWYGQAYVMDNEHAGKGVSEAGSGCSPCGLWESYLPSIVMGTLYCKKQRPSDKTLNQGPDFLWSLKIPGCTSKKSRGVTPASWPNPPTGL